MKKSKAKGSSKEHEAKLELIAKIQKNIESFNGKDLAQQKIIEKELLRNIKKLQNFY